MATKTYIVKKIDWYTIEAESERDALDKAENEEGYMHSDWRVKRKPQKSRTP